VIERNPITGDPILIVPEREERPNIFRQDIDRCPFCPGNEEDTPPEIWRDGDPWRIRIFPNKYPASDRHEVIVESPQHAATFDRLAPEDASRVVEQYVERYRTLSAVAQYVCIFKNHGYLAGASIPHMHSQILAAPFLPPRIEREMAKFTTPCPLCSLNQHQITETANYRWIAPPGSSMAYEQWIIPKRHASEMNDPRELATLLQRAARAMLSIADSFNWIFMNFPRHPPAHWYVQLFPRSSMHAGFEVGTGSAINTVDPAAAALRLASPS
jgi:UDPglucose--hexose-1-phosphate uridylyltransferase